MFEKESHQCNFIATFEVSSKQWIERIYVCDAFVELQKCIEKSVWTNKDTLTPHSLIDSKFLCMKI